MTIINVNIIQIIDREELNFATFFGKYIFANEKFYETCLEKFEELG